MGEEQAIGIGRKRAIEKAVGKPHAREKQRNEPKEDDLSEAARSWRRWRAEEAKLKPRLQAARNALSKIENSIFMLRIKRDELRRKYGKEPK